MCAYDFTGAGHEVLNVGVCAVFTVENGFVGAYGLSVELREHLYVAPLAAGPLDARCAADMGAAPKAFVAHR